MTKVVNPEGGAPGHVRLADLDDAEIVVWGRLHGEEKPTLLDFSRIFWRTSKEQIRSCWEDDGLRTLIAMSGHKRNGIRVSTVFTPIQYRGKDNAAVAVSSVIRHFLNERCALCTLSVDCQDRGVMSSHENRVRAIR